jgi:hypothetical protein
MLTLDLLIRYDKMLRTPEVHRGSRLQEGSRPFNTAPGLCRIPLAMRLSDVERRWFAADMQRSKLFWSLQRHLHGVKWWSQNESDWQFNLHNIPMD